MAFIIGWLIGGALITGLLSLIGYVLLGTGLAIAELCVVVKKIFVGVYKVLRWFAIHAGMLIKQTKGDDEEFIEQKRGFVACVTD